MKNYYKKTLYILTAVLISASTYAQDYSEGIFILNEGLYGTNSASLSSIDTQGTLENDVFSTQNSEMELGNTAQGMGFNGDYAYVVLNGSNEVKVINATTFAFVASITDQISSPRNIAFYNGYGYVTDWGDPIDTEDDYVAVIDLETNTITETIAVAEGPEEIVEKDGILFVAHQGGYGYGNSVSVIDLAADTVASIAVGDVPTSIKIDDDFLYVLSSGKHEWTGDETLASIHKIDLSDYDNEEVFNFAITEHPSYLTIDDTDLFYVLNGDIFKMALTATELPTTAFNSDNSAQTPYGLEKIDDKLYLLDAVGYVNPGKVYVYDETGSYATEYTVGDLPNGVYQNNSNSLNVDDYTLNNITLYPNPASRSFNLNLSENARVKMHDISGKLVKDINYTNTQAIALDGIESGIYLVTIELNQNTSTLKLIVR